MRNSPHRRARRPRRRLVRRVLTSNVTIACAAIAALMAVVVNISSFGFAKADPPAMAGDLSTNDMLAMLTASDMDPMAADAVAAAKKRAYERQQQEEREARERAEYYRKNRKKIEASRTAEALRTINPSVRQNKAFGRMMNDLKGWSRCWKDLEVLWTKESSWNERAENPSSGAYGIPQALPPEKLSSAGKDWRTSAPTQIAWGLGYIKARYGDPCKAWDFWQAHNWY